MRRLLSIITIISISLSTLGQTAQSGFIKEYCEKATKKPLSGVELDVRYANSTVTDKKGAFTLNFLTLKPGQRVNVRDIHKAGYELFNKEAIEQWNINPSTPFTIVMCRQDRFKKIRDNYERVSSESYKRQFDAEKLKLDQLMEAGKLMEAEYNKQLSELYELHEKQLDNLMNYVDRFSRIDLSELSAEEQKIIDLVQQGKIDEAIANYDSQNYVAKFSTQVKEFDKANEAIARLEKIKAEKDEALTSLLGSINRQIETLKLAGGKENFDKILTLYGQVVETGYFEPEFLSAYLTELTQQGFFDKALELGTKFVANENIAPLAKHKIWTKIGNVQKLIGNYDGSLKSYEAAYEILSQVAPSESEYANYRKKVILSNMALVNQTLKNYPKAIKLNEEAKIENPDGYDQSNSEISRLINYMIVFRQLGKYDKADSLGHIAQKIIDDTPVITNDQRNDIDYATAILHQGLGNSAVEQRDFPKAHKFYQLSLTTQEQLYLKNPRKHAVQLGIINYNMGRSYFNEPDSGLRAIPYFERAINIYGDFLSNQFSQQVLIDYAQTLTLLCRVHSDANDTSSCLSLAEKATEKLNELSSKPLNLWRLQMAIASIYGDVNQFDKALSIAETALPKLQLAYESSPYKHNDDMGTLHSNLAFYSFKINDIEKVRENSKLSVEFFEKDYTNNPMNKPNLVYALNRGALFLMESEHTDDVFSFLRRAQELEPENPQFLKIEFVLLMKAGKTEEAETVMKKFQELETK